MHANSSAWLRVKSAILGLIFFVVFAKKINFLIDCRILLSKEIINSRKDLTFYSQSYIIKFSLSLCLFVSMFVQNRLQNHAYYGDEAFADDSVGLGLGQ